MRRNESSLKMITWSKHCRRIEPMTAFHKRALPRRSRSAENFVDVHDRDLLAEFLPIDAIAILQQLFRCGVERKGLEQLLRGPFSGRMGCDVKVDNTASVVSENDEDEEDFKPNRADSEEVDGSELGYVIVEERFPRLR